MKNKLFLLTVIAILVVSSCIVKSIHPFYTDKDLVFKTELLGIWLDSDSCKWDFTQRTHQENFLGPEKKDNSYKAVYYEEENEISYFNVHLFTLKGKYYLDFLPDVEDNIGDKFASSHFVPTHSIARVEFVGEKNFCLFWYDQEWLSNLFEQNKIKISNEHIDISGEMDEYLLTAETAELQKFIVKYGSEIKVFEEINFDSIRNIKDEIEIHNTIIEKMENYNNSDDDRNDVIYLSIRKINDVE